MSRVDAAKSPCTKLLMASEENTSLHEVVRQVSGKVHLIYKHSLDMRASLGPVCPQSLYPHAALVTWTTFPRLPS